MFDYGVDYGFPDGEVFVSSDDPAGQKHTGAIDTFDTLGKWDLGEGIATKRATQTTLQR
jgi:hypothetical protein